MNETTVKTARLAPDGGSYAVTDSGDLVQLEPTTERVKRSEAAARADAGATAAPAPDAQGDADTASRRARRVKE
jgi:hypothetical protein